MYAHEIDYEIHGEEMQFVEIELDPNETVIAEAGSFMMMDDGIKMETIFGDGSRKTEGLFGKIVNAGKRLLTGEGLFMAALRKPCSAEIQMVSAKETDSFLQKNALFPAGKQEGNDSFPIVEVDYPTAISYLRGEALVLPPDTPRGLVSIAFQGHRLGEAKNIGNRANNLYPKEWRIKSTHIPKEYETILRLA